MSDMQSAASSGSPTLTESPSMSAAELAALVHSQAEKIAALEHQLEWFRRQIFGQKSERFAPEPDPNQLHLGETFPAPAAPVEERKPIAAHSRRSAQHDGAENSEELPFFDESKVPVRILTLYPSEVQGLAQDQYKIIGEKVTYRIAQRPLCRRVADG
jgi:transposase